MFAPPFYSPPALKTKKHHDTNLRPGMRLSYAQGLIKAQMKGNLEHKADDPTVSLLLISSPFYSPALSLSLQPAASPPLSLPSPTTPLKCSKQLFLTS